MPDASDALDVLRNVPITRVLDGQAAPATDRVIGEARVEVDVNDGALRVAMLCLPRDLEALAVGFLRGEGVLPAKKDLKAVVFLPAQRRILVRGAFDGEALKRVSLRWTWGTGCGGGGTGRDIEATLSGRPSPADWVHPAEGAPPLVSTDRLARLWTAFQARTDLWRETGGVHACALAAGEHVLLYAEDVGRHNAFDKVVGMAWLQDIGLSDKVVLTTGRLSAEIVAKAVASGMRMLASRSAVTALAIELAQRAGLTLIGFLRGHRMNVYAGAVQVSARTEPKR